MLSQEQSEGEIPTVPSAHPPETMQGWTTTSLWSQSTCCELYFLLQTSSSGHPRAQVRIARSTPGSLSFLSAVPARVPRWSQAQLNRDGASLFTAHPPQRCLSPELQGPPYRAAGSSVRAACRHRPRSVLLLLGSLCFWHLTRLESLP